MKKIRIKLIFSLLLLSLTTAFAADFPAKPNPPRLVNDFVGIFDETQKAVLEQKLVAFNDTTSTQIAVVVVDDLLGYDKGEYTIQLAEKWGIGQEGKDNGILIMIKPTGGAGERHAFIAVGYGLEGAIPDAIANRIVELEMIPEFKNGNYYEGVDRAVNTLMSLTSGEFTAEEYGNSTEKVSGAIILLVIGLFAIFFLLVPSMQARKYMKTNNVGYWLALWMILNSGSRSGSGSWNSFMGGSGGFRGFGGGGGGFGGGGFGGFGGGSFGGGGAGGSW